MCSTTKAMWRRSLGCLRTLPGAPSVMLARAMVASPLLAIGIATTRQTGSPSRPPLERGCHLLCAPRYWLPLTSCSELAGTSAGPRGLPTNLRVLRTETRTPFRRRRRRRRLGGGRRCARLSLGPAWPGSRGPHSWAGMISNNARAGGGAVHAGFPPPARATSPAAGALAPSPIVGPSASVPTWLMPARGNTTGSRLAAWFGAPFAAPTPKKEHAGWQLRARGLRRAAAAAARRRWLVLRSGSTPRRASRLTGITCLSLAAEAAAAGRTIAAATVLRQGLAVSTPRGPAGADAAAVLPPLLRLPRPPRLPPRLSPPRPPRPVRLRPWRCRRAARTKQRAAPPRLRRPPRSARSSGESAADFGDQARSPISSSRSGP